MSNPRKYRSPDGEDIRVVTDTGHIAIVGAEFRELPAIYHHAAINAGCECDALGVSNTRTKPQASPQANKGLDVDEQITRALKTMLEREEDGDFTGNGDPNLNAVAKLVGFKVARKQVQPIFTALKEEAEGEEDEGDEEDQG